MKYANNIEEIIEKCFIKIEQKSCTCCSFRLNDPNKAPCHVCHPNNNNWQLYKDYYKDISKEVIEFVNANYSKI